MKHFASSFPDMERETHSDDMFFEARYSHAKWHEPELISLFNNLRHKPTDIKKKRPRKY
jgi:hypothetical protein